MSQLAQSLTAKNQYMICKTLCICHVCIWVDASLNILRHRTSVNFTDCILSLCYLLNEINSSYYLDNKYSWTDDIKVNATHPGYIFAWDIYKHWLVLIGPWEMWYSNFTIEVFKCILRIDIFSTSCTISLTWVPQKHTDNKSTLVQVMAWCRQAPSHYLSLCWPRYMPQYGITRPQ